MSIWLRVGGYPATEIAAHTPPTWETWADGGTGSITWAFSLSMRSQHQALRPGVVVEVMCGPGAIATGLLTDPDRTTWECVAYGLASDAKRYLALDTNDHPTRDLGIAIAGARSAGWQVVDSSAMSGVAAGDDLSTPLTLDQLVQQRADELGQRWGVDGKRRLYMRSDPTAPKWITSPDSAAFGITNEDRANTLVGKYLDSATSTELTVKVGSGAPQVAVDLTAGDRGALSTAQAISILSGVLARDYRGPAWTNGVVLDRDQLQTMGGTPAFLPSVQAGQMTRSFGLSSALNGVALDTIIGKTRHTAGSRSIYLEPVNTAARSTVDVLAS